MAYGTRERVGLRAVVFVFILSIVVLEFPGARDLIRSPFSGIQTQNLVVQSLHPGSPNADLPIRPGDEIVAVDDVRIRNHNHLRYVVASNESFAPQVYTFRRDGSEFTATVRYTSISRPIIYRGFASLLVGFTFLLVAILVLLRRADAVGILFALNCAIFAFLLSDRPVFAMSGLQLFEELFYDAVILLFPAVFLHFFVVFHERPLTVTRRRRTRRIALLYALPSAVLVVSSIVAIRSFTGVQSNPAVVSAILALSTLYMVVYLVASLFIFVRNYRAASRAQKEKLRIAIAGTVFGLLPFLFTVVWRQIFPGQHTPLEFVSVLALSFISISFAYAILKHGAIELNIVVRRSLAYAFLTGVLIASYYLGVNLLGDYLTREFALEPIYFSFITILVLAVIFTPARERVQQIVDRAFFRGDYDYKEEVVEFNRQLAGKLERDEIFEFFSARLQGLLQPAYVVYYEKRDDRWARLWTSGDASGQPESFPIESVLGRYLTRYKKPLMAEYLDYSWGPRHLDGQSGSFLTDSGAAVCLPLAKSDSVFGLVVLGPKRSGRLYNRTDSSLLERFTEHLSLVLEHSELHETAIEQERLKNEVLLAREIQLSLLPKASPKHPAMSIVGKMVSSVEVGGDFFDYFLLEPDRIAVAIGDVSGKGVPAAMLMSSIQAVFKNLAVRESLAPAELVAELNRHVCSTAETGRFATFFYGIIDTQRSTFTYSNAGHCPALLLRRDYTDRLREGGLPLGVQETQEYLEGQVRIAEDDLLCLYTDGVSEQSKNGSGEFGESGVLSFLEKNRNLPVSQVQESLFAAVLDFGQGMQDDDMTAIIARHNAF